MEPVLSERHNPNDTLEDMKDVNIRRNNADCGDANNHPNLRDGDPNSFCNRSLFSDAWSTESNMWDIESPAHLQMEVSSVMSFASSSGGVPLDQVLTTPDESRRSSQHLEAKVDMVYSLLAMLGGQEHTDMGETLLALSTNPESCLAMRQSGCLPLLVQLVQSDKEAETRKKAAEALHNLVHSQPDEKLRKRETRILKILETISAYTEALENNTEFICDNLAQDGDRHPVQTLLQMMKFSFDEGHRQAICQLGGIHSVAKLVEVEHSIHGSVTEETNCNLLRRFACMVLTNLTFGDSGNKALLCSYKNFIRGLVVQLQSPSDELRQVTASVLRNLSWRADSTSKEILKEVGAVKGLMAAAMLDNKENTLISILSALWNLSAHCTENKSEICSVKGSLVFLVKMLSFKSSSESSAVIENSGGILRNISSQISGSEEYRRIIRKHNCLQTLLDHLKSPSLTIISNACGTLWNLSSKNTIDQELLWKLGAPSLLRTLNTSKHKMIAMGSSATLKNLLHAKPGQVLSQMDTEQPLDLSVVISSKGKNEKAIPIKNPEQCSHEIIDEVDSPLDLSKKPTEMSPVFVKKSRDVKSSSFANLNEPASSNSHEKRSKMLQSCGTSSLPYVNSTKSGRQCSTMPLRHKCPDNYEDELEYSEEPYDFSRRYSETRPPNNVPKNKGTNEATYKYEKPKNENENFSIYAETDLDQPTDYSLRYAENDSDTDESDACENVGKTPTEFVRDTVKTYCTEGTPYETPLNFSTSTSMSDLRMGEKNMISTQKDAVVESKTKEVVLNVDEKDQCSPELNSESETQQPQTSKIKSEYSSGLMSPEKPRNYCEEGTPGYFSRVSSFGSLNSSPVCLGEEKGSGEKQKCENEVVSPKDDKIQQKEPASEVKVVKFESNVNYCEETPLMFSRSSSLGSLDSIEQHSIHDDRSSVISDFSRLTSGIISPSELPDSPTQTVPPSPKPQNAPEFPVIHKRSSGDGRPQTAIRRSLPKASVFEDDVTKFKEENTPTQYSIGTSLSSLTIDDQEEGQMRESAEEDSSIRGGKPHFNRGTQRTNPQEELDRSEFMRGGIRASTQTRRHSNLLPAASRQSTSSFQSPSNLSRYIPPTDESTSKSSPRILPTLLPGENTVHTYCTEDTPAVLSHNGSISDLSLSTLSILDEEEPALNRVYYSENCSQSSGRDENIVMNGRQPEVLQNRQEMENIWERREHIERCSSRLDRENIEMPSYHSARDEVSRFAVEDSPMQFSLRSSLSNLTFESSMTSGTKDVSPRKPMNPKPGPSKEKTENLAEGNINNSREKITLDEEYSDVEELTRVRLTTNLHATEECLALHEEERQSVANVSDEVNSTFSDGATCVAPLRSGDVISYNSLKKRKWKWRWKFGSEGPSRESASLPGPPLNNDERLDMRVNTEASTAGRDDASYSRSLDASYRKKKWWKWKFGTKDSEHSLAVSTDFPKSDPIILSNQEVDDEGTGGTSKTIPSEREEDAPPFRRGESSCDTRSKSKRWKWKWRFGSKEGDNSRSEELLSLGLSKLKHTVSPIVPRESRLVGEQLEPAFQEKERESRSVTTRPSLKKLSRSVSEPRTGKKRSEEAVVTKLSKNSSISSLLDSDENTQQNEQRSIDNKTTEIISSAIQISSTRETSVDRRVILASEAFDTSSCSTTKILSNSDHIATDYQPEEDIAEVVPQNKPDYAALVEECIQLGMPKKKELSTQNCDCETDAASAARSMPDKSNKSLPGVVTRNQAKSLSSSASVDHMSILEECIQLGMPKLKDNSLTKMASSKSSVNFPRKPSSNFQRPISGSSDTASDEKFMELSKRDQKSKDNIINKISRVLSLDRTPKPSVSKNADTESTSRDIIEQFFKSSPRPSSNKIAPNDLEFLKRQLDRVDKHLLRESIERGITKEEEAYLVEMFIVNRISEERKRVKEARSKKEAQAIEHAQASASALPSSPSKKSQKSDDPSKDEIMIYSEDHLDPVTLSIVKRILHYRFAQSENNIDEGLEDAELEDIDDFAVHSTKESDLEIVLPERMKMISSKNEESKNEKGVYISSREESKNEKGVYISSREESTISRTYKPDTRPMSGRSQSGDKNSQSLVEKTSELPKRAVSEISYTTNDESPLKIGASSSSNRNPDYAALIEECIQLGMPKRKELSEEAIYANVSLSPGYSRSNSMPRQRESPSKNISGNNGKAVLPQFGMNSSKPAEHHSLVEECIMMGMPRKKVPGVENNVCRDISIETTERIANPCRIDKKTANVALLEECIQMGMPRNKEGIEIRPSFQKTVTSQSNSSSRNPSVNLQVVPKKDYKQHYQSLVEECIQLGITKKNKEPEEVIYANVSTTAGYSRSDSMNRLRESPSKCTSPLPDRTVTSQIDVNIGNKGDKNRNYSALVEECIQLGMPVKKPIEANALPGKINLEGSSINPKQNKNYQVLIEECIQLGMPKKKESPEEAIYANTTERYSTFKSATNTGAGLSRSSPKKMIRSDSEPGPNKIPSVSFENNRRGLSGASSTSMDRALEECIQIGWPKKRETVTISRSSMNSESSRVILVERPREPESKNVDVASVARNTPESRRMYSRVPIMVTGAEDDSRLQDEAITIEHPDVEETLLADLERNGSSFNNFRSYLTLRDNPPSFDDDIENRSEMSFASLAEVDAKLLDPEEMLRSLDKYTAELISQAESRIRLEDSSNKNIDANVSIENHTRKSQGGSSSGVNAGGSRRKVVNFRN